jgi:NAD(P)-dependent dehydrogenase (short-subunit alcohol dehydrogenase family)
MGSLGHKTALVTGASRGIGRAPVLALGEAGAHAIVHCVCKQVLFGCKESDKAVLPQEEIIEFKGLRYRLSWLNDC